MQTTGISSKQNFQGIKLSNNGFDHVRVVVMHLKSAGFDCLGKKTIYVNNTFIEKSNKINNIRENTFWGDREFGALFLPWSKEAYIIAPLEYEQVMLPVVNELDKKAQINILM